jgi:hypothetical protein
MCQTWRKLDWGRQELNMAYPSWVLYPYFTIENWVGMWQTHGVNKEASSPSKQLLVQNFNIWTRLAAPMPISSLPHPWLTPNSRHRGWHSATSSSTARRCSTVAHTPPHDWDRPPHPPTPCSACCTWPMTYTLAMSISSSPPTGTDTTKKPVLNKSWSFLIGLHFN